MKIGQLVKYEFDAGYFFRDIAVRVVSFDDDTVMVWNESEKTMIAARHDQVKEFDSVKSTATN